jgi:hypothetical protein
MSSEDSYAVQSGRQSSDGTPSEHANSDGNNTAMTSIVGTDEEPHHHNDSDLEEDVDEDDMISIYPASQYPRVSPSLPGRNSFLSRLPWGRLRYVGGLLNHTLSVTY